jgi:hypothetical protein
MKYWVFLLAATLFFATAGRANPVLGKTYSRSMQSIPLANSAEFADFVHTLSFRAGGLVIDNANAFYGKAPQGCFYQLWSAPGESLEFVFRSVDHVDVTCKSPKDGHEYVRTFDIMEGGKLLLFEDTEYRLAKS